MSKQDLLTQLGTVFLETRGGKIFPQFHFFRSACCQFARRVLEHRHQASLTDPILKTIKNLSENFPNRTMKVLHLGNPYFKEDLEELGHEVLWASSSPTADCHLPTPFITWQAVFSRFPHGWTPDCVILGDDSAQPPMIGLESLPIPLVWYTIDTHLHASWHRYYAPVFDIILVAQQDWQSTCALARHRQILQWAPLFINSRQTKHLNLAREIPLAFVGTMNARLNPKRVQLIEHLVTRYPITVQSGPFLDTFNRAKIVLNQSINGDVNFRTFEAMACGALLLTERSPNGLADLFRDGRECAYYEPGNVDHIIEQAEYYAHHQEERERVAHAGYTAVMEAHTSLHRAQLIMDLLKSPHLPSMMNQRHLDQANIQWYLTKVYQACAQRCEQAAMANPEHSPAFRRIGNLAEQYRLLSTTIQNTLAPFKEQLTATDTGMSREAS